MNHVKKKRQIILVATECNWPQKVFLHLKPQTHFFIQIECFFKDPFLSLDLKISWKRVYSKSFPRIICICRQPGYVSFLFTLFE